MSIKGILEEGTKVKKHYKQLELHLSHWLNLIYLENMILFFKEHHQQITEVDDNVSHAVLAFGTMKLRSSF